MWNSQAELEKEMSLGGKERAQRMMTRNEEGGRAAHNPYAKTVFNRYVLPLSEVIKADMEEGGAGKRKSHVVLLRSVEPETAAYIAIRHVLTAILEDVDEGNFRKISYGIGRAIQSECVLRQYESMDQKSFFLLQQDLQRRHSQNLRHRMTVAGMKMRELGIEPIDWGYGARDQVGAYLMDKMIEMGLLDVHRGVKGVNGKPRKIWTVSLSDEVSGLVDNVRDLVEQTMPYFLPCIEKPMDWVDVHDGGFHTTAMRKMAPSAIINGNTGGGDPTEVLEAINTLQAVKWSINSQVLDVAKELSGIIETEEIVNTLDVDRPRRPDFLDTIKKEEMSDIQKQLFKEWKWDTSEWHTARKLKQQRYARMINVFRVSEQFRDERELYFVYHADFRGRFYPMTTGPNPQGSDLQKAVLHFTEGKPLRDQASIDWFRIHGANKFGVDKEPFEDRIQWVKDNEEMILAVSQDPVENLDLWINSDAPFQFLAWCFEYAEWYRYRRAFVSRLPISMDGSCNGLQNFSAMLRDQVGGKATNLIPADRPQDIYTEVAQKTLEMLRLMEEDDNHFRSRWISHGIPRSLVKRSVMTLPYGSTRFSCRDFILKDYMNKEEPKEFEKREYPKAAGFLSKVVWDAIGSVVIKAREAMDWLQSCSGKILDEHGEIRWTTPNGFVVSQRYQALEKAGRIRVNIFGGAMFSVSKRSKKADRVRHRNGIAPNFIHSLDAAHMQRVVNRCKREGINALAMIHDDFGTLAADAERFSRIIREEFVSMYEEDNWLEKFAQGYIDLGVPLEMPPKPGTLDISQVLDSKYFFS